LEYIFINERRGYYFNYDLVYSEGFSEARSVGGRDYEYKILLQKIKERNQDLNNFRELLESVRKGELKPSAGGGLGIERLIRFLTNSYHIKDTTPFPKVSGKK
jgi:asparaginyl-tRNA synthetase